MAARLLSVWMKSWRADRGHAGLGHLCDGCEGRFTIASSNWQTPESFVGSNYAFRTIFAEPWKRHMAEHYALGNVSRRPGLYISQADRWRRWQAARRVVIAKVEFNRLETDWEYRRASRLHRRFQRWC